MPHLNWLRWLAFLSIPACAMGLVAGCSKKDAQHGKPPPEQVMASPAVVWEIEDYQDFTGRVEAIKRVEIRAMVSGCLQPLHFKEGAEVHKGQLLFVIDPLVYEAKYNQADANVTQTTVRAQRLKKDFDRAVKLYARDAMSREDYDKISGDYKEADAAVKVALANRQLAQVDLGYTKIYAPFSGRISRAAVDPGNLIKANETSLTTLVSLDPVYAYFDIDERTLLRFRRLLERGKIKSSRDVEVPVYFALADEDDFIHTGAIHWADNKLEPSTGTLRVRGLFDNPMRGDPVKMARTAASTIGCLALPHGLGPAVASFALYPGRAPQTRILSPGLFVRVRLPLGAPYQGIVVPEESVGSDQGQKYVYVVEKVEKDKKYIDEVAYRKVVVGPQVKVYIDETDPKNPVAYRKFKAGRQVHSFRVVEPLKYKLKRDGTHELKDGRKVIESGLLPGERVVVKGLQRVRSGKEVTPTEWVVPAKSPMVETVVKTP